MWYSDLLIQPSAKRNPNDSPLPGTEQPCSAIVHLPLVTALILQTSLQSYQHMAKTRAQKVCVGG